MAWKTMDIQEQRVRFVVAAAGGTKRFSTLCAEFGISIHAENAGDGDHQDDGKRATAPGVGGDQGRLQVEGRSLNGHENPPRRK